jgi:hypothetical protein
VSVQNCRVGLFSKRQVPAGATPLPRLTAIGDPERDWIDAHLGLMADSGTDLDDVLQIRSLYERSLAAWRRINPPERDDPNVMINAIGMAYGEHLIRRAPLSWMIAEDEHGTELALYEPRRETLVYPANLVAEHWAAEDASGEFLVADAERVVDQVAGRRRVPR